MTVTSTRAAEALADTCGRSDRWMTLPAPGQDHGWLASLDSAGAGQAPRSATAAPASGHIQSAPAPSRPEPARRAATRSLSMFSCSVHSAALLSVTCRGVDGRSKDPGATLNPADALRAPASRGVRSTAGARPTSWPRRPSPRPRAAARRLPARDRANDSPDIPFDLSINPYRGCEHGCIYCFARPTHSLSRSLAGPRLRDQALRQGQCRRAPAARAGPAGYTPAARSRSAPTPTPTSRSSASCGMTREVLEVLAECGTRSG